MATKRSTQSALNGDAASPVVVAVLTYRRTDELPATIRTLLTACADRPEASVLVVDNNPGADAEPTVTRIAADVRPGLLRYVHEPEPGIAAARNRAMDESSAADRLVFIDDDERPTEGWLTHLLAMHDEHRPAAIAGPVISEFARDPEPWVVAGEFFTRRRLATGTAIDCAATNNLLLDLVQVRASGIRFAAEFGLSGGSDTLFTRQLVKEGHTILWCDEAVVIDEVPAERLTRRWVLQKAFRQGNVTPRVNLTLLPRGRSRSWMRLSGLVGGIARFVAGCGGMLAGVVMGDIGRRARGGRLLARGAGMALGSLGYRYVEYSRANDKGLPRFAWGSADDAPAETGGS